MSCASPLLPVADGMYDGEILFGWVLVAMGVVMFTLIFPYFFKHPPPMTIPPEGADLSVAKDNDAPFPAMYFIRGNLPCPFSWALRRELDRHTLSVCREAGDGMPVGGECTVCLGDLGRAGTKERRLGCGHWFHWDCIDGWLVYCCNNSCPTCMRKVLDGRDEGMRSLKNWIR